MEGVAEEQYDSETRCMEGIAESIDDLPSSPTLLPREKGARTPVPSS
jgi:hypothetical protein